MPGNARVLKAQGVHAPCQWFLHNVITVTVKRHLHRARQQAETQARAESPPYPGYYHFNLVDK